MEHNFNFNFDIYLQNFFLFVFQRLYKDPAQLQETETQTFLNKSVAETIADEILVFAADSSKSKYINQTNYFI